VRTLAAIEDEDWDQFLDDVEAELLCHECMVPIGEGWCDGCAASSGAMGEDEDGVLA
jgi:hypothetical protein